MSWRQLLTQKVAYKGPAMSVAEVEALVQQARARHRERLTTLDRLSKEQAELREEMSSGIVQSSTVWDVMSAAIGPGEVTPHIRNLLSQVPVMQDLVDVEPDATLLEEKLEVAQRRVLQLAHHLDRLAADRSALNREMGTLHKRIGLAGADADAAADALLALNRAMEDVDRAREAAPDTDALRRLDGDRTVLESLLLQREAELRAFQTTERRLQSILMLHHEFLRLNENLHKSLTRLHQAGTDVLDELDTHLAGLAAEAQARDLARHVSGSMGSLRDSVHRVNRLASENAVLLTENLDRLADEVDVLAPADPAALAAQEEVATMLRNRTVADAVARARAQVEVRAKVAAQTDGDPE